MRTRNNIIKSNCVPEVYSVIGGGPGALKCSSSRDYYGDGQIVENGSLAMSRYGGGYFDSDGSPFYYFSDYQGNNISVVDNKGNVCQSTDYYPYGEVWRLDNALTLGTKNTFLYSDKEYLSMDGLHEYDFSARRQTPAVPGFNRMDTECEKYYDINPYVFCAGNPVMNIDPTGKDIYTFNDKGMCISREENTENDIIKIDGSDAQLTLDYGTIKDQYHPEHNFNVIGLIMEVEGDINGTKVFEFLADNTHVEWGNMKTGKDSSGTNFITTSYSPNSEAAFDYVIGKFTNLREKVHSHPNGEPYPSFSNYTLKNSKRIMGDVPIAKYLSDKFNNDNIKFYIYIPKTKRYIEYSKDTKSEHFRQAEIREINKEREQLGI